MEMLISPLVPTTRATDESRKSSGHEWGITRGDCAKKGRQLSCLDSLERLRHPGADDWPVCQALSNGMLDTAKTRVSIRMSGHHKKQRASEDIIKSFDLCISSSSLTILGKTFNQLLDNPTGLPEIAQIWDPVQLSSKEPSCL